MSDNGYTVYLSLFKISFPKHNEFPFFTDFHYIASMEKSAPANKKKKKLN